MTGWLGSPGSLGGLAPSVVTPSGGAGQADFDVTVPAVPTGWTALDTVAAVVLDNDPAAGTNWYSYAASDVAATHAPSITGLAAGTYRYAAWVTYTRPDLRIAYGPSVGGTVVVT